MANRSQRLDTTGQSLWIPAENGAFTTGRDTKKTEGAGDKLVHIFEAQDGSVVKVPAAKKSLVTQVEEDHLMGVPDVTSLRTVSHASVLETCKRRYSKNEIYTKVDDVIISINPFAMISGLYDAEAISKYESCTDPREMPPHVYCIAKAAMNGLHEGRNQAILISGESGAGKTENCKILLGFFAVSAGSKSGVQDRIMQCNPLLEAFGNAKTARNNNSSRFGKWTALKFNNRGDIQGAGIVDYLLEKSRAVSQNKPERSFHIFHMMLQDPGKYGLHSGKHTDYFNLKGADATADGWDDKKELGEVLAAANDTTMSDDTTQALLEATAGVLLIGNISLADAGNDSTKCDKKDTLDAAAKALGCEAEVLMLAIIQKKLMVVRDITIKQLKLDDAIVSRKSLATLFYQKIFTWLVEFLNRAIASGEDGGGAAKEIGMLDIAGFESFEFNTWEQITINLSNENLQQHFNDFVFKAEMRDYEAEGVPTGDFKFADNQEILDTIGAPQNSIFSYLDSTTKNIKATDEIFIGELKKNMASNKYLTLDRFGAPKFTLIHYAGAVTYDCVGWVAVKNRDEPPPEALDVLKTCQNPVMVQIYEKMAEEEKAAKKTVSQQFRASLKELMTAIYAAQPHFVRCIKPNMAKKPGIFDAAPVLEQLTNSGVIEAVHIRQAGYPYRAAPADFVKRYRVCIPFNLLKTATSAGGGDLSKVEAVKAILDGLPQAFNMPDLKGQFFMGKTKVMIRQKGHQALDEMSRIAKVAKAVMIQRCYRGYRARKRVRVAKATRTAIAGWLKKYPLYSAPGKDGITLFGNLEGLANALSQASEWLTVARNTPELKVAPEKFESTVHALQKEQSVMERETDLLESTDVMELKEAISTLKALNIDNDFSKKIARRQESLIVEAPLIKGMQALPPIDIEASKEDGKKALNQYRQLVKQCEEAGRNAEDKWLDVTGFKLFEAVQACVSKYNSGSFGGDAKAQDAAYVQEATGIVGGIMAAGPGGAEECQGLLFAEGASEQKENIAAAAEAMKNSRECVERANGMISAGNTTDMKVVEDLCGAIDAKQEAVAKLSEAIKAMPDGQEKSQLEALRATEGKEAKDLENALNAVCAQTGCDPIKVAMVKGDFEKKKAHRENEGARPSRVSMKVESMKSMKQALVFSVTDAADCLVQLDDAMAVYDADKIKQLYAWGVSNGVSQDDLKDASAMLDNLSTPSYVRDQLTKLVTRLLSGQETNNTTRLLKACTNLLSAAEQCGISSPETLRTMTTLKQVAATQFGSMFVRAKSETVQVGQALYSRWDQAPIINTQTVKTRYKKDGTKVDPLDPLGACSWTKYKMPGSLTKLPTTGMTDAAMNIFKNLCAWMCDHPVDNRRRAPLAYTIIHKARMEPSLTNEVYTQIMKQLTNNPGMRSKLLGWKLLQHLVNQVPPQEDFIEYVRAFLLNALQNEDKNDKLLYPVIQDTQAAVKKYDGNLGGMGNKASGVFVEAETANVWSMEAYDLREGMARLDSTGKPRKPKLVSVEPEMTAKQVAQKCAQTLSLQSNQSEFSVFRVNHSEPLGHMRNVNLLLKKEPNVQLMFKRRFIKPREVVSTVDMVYTCLTVEQALQEYLMEYLVPENTHKFAWVGAQIACYLTRARKTKEFVSNENTLRFLIPASQLPRKTPKEWQKMIMSELYLNHVLENAGDSHLARAAILLKALQRLKAFASRQFVGVQRSHERLATDDSKRLIRACAVREDVAGNPRKPLVEMGNRNLICCVSISSVTFFSNDHTDRDHYGQELAKVGFSTARGHHLIEWDMQGNAVYLAMKLPKGKEVFMVFDTVYSERMVDRMDRAYVEDYKDEGTKIERDDLKSRIETRSANDAQAGGAAGLSATGATVNATNQTISPGGAASILAGASMRSDVVPAGGSTMTTSAGVSATGSKVASTGAAIQSAAPPASMQQAGQSAISQDRMTTQRAPTAAASMKSNAPGASAAPGTASVQASAAAPAGSIQASAAAPAGSIQASAAAPAGSIQASAAAPAGSIQASAAAPAGSIQASAAAPAGSIQASAAAPVGSMKASAAAPAGSIVAPAGAAASAVVASRVGGDTMDIRSAKLASGKQSMPAAAGGSATRSEVLASGSTTGTANQSAPLGQGSQTGSYGKAPEE